MSKLLCRWLGHRWRLVRVIWPYEPAWFAECGRCHKCTVTVPGHPFVRDQPKEGV